MGRYSRVRIDGGWVSASLPAGDYNHGAAKREDVFAKSVGALLDVHRAREIDPRHEHEPGLCPRELGESGELSGRQPASGAGNISERECSAGERRADLDHCDRW